MMMMMMIIGRQNIIPIMTWTLKVLAIHNTHIHTHRMHIIFFLFFVSYPRINRQFKFRFFFLFFLFPPSSWLLSLFTLVNQILCVFFRSKRIFFFLFYSIFLFCFVLPSILVSPCFIIINNNVLIIFVLFRLDSFWFIAVLLLFLFLLLLIRLFIFCMCVHVYASGYFPVVILFNFFVPCVL